MSILVDNPNPYTAQGVYPRRGGNVLSGTCIVHTSEGPWTAGVDSLTNFVKTRTDYGCYHRACDWEDIAVYYPWEWETWQDSETNPWAVGIAAACRTTDWAIMPTDIRNAYYRNMGIMAADFVNYMKSKGVTVPLRRITGQEARNRVPGFAAHGDSGISRSDPGADFDWNYFFTCTADALGGRVVSPTTTPSRGFLMALTDKQQDELYAMVKNLHDDYRQGIPGVQSDGDSFNLIRSLAAKNGVHVDEKKRRAKWFGKRKHVGTA